MGIDDASKIQASRGTTNGVAEARLNLRLAIADYDRIRPLIDGRVRPEGFDLAVTTDDIVQFCVRPVYEEFDVAEMSMSWYIAARARGEPCVALPVFPLRMAVLGYLYCHTDAPYTHPRELVGKRIATPAFRYTVNVWLRGILRDHYGLAAEQMTWVTNEAETNQYVIPRGINVIVVPDKPIGQLLVDGEVDAIMSPTPPPEFRRGDPRIRRLFRNARSESAAYFRKTGIYPITHTVVVHQQLAREKPWAAAELVRAFRASQALCDAYYQQDPKRLSLPGAAFIVEEERRDYGANPWSHGLAGNRETVETFIRYAHEQGYIDRPIPIEEFFADGTLTV
ncbi:MAG: hypothetical protein A3G25_20395 [Betaproteobacteria bacterium RIFCSPLOWO2_12_FULL_63_13]|nr:MAG: hypothetical protein A3G25_20395 [Betaproteobacteria bacterium RIFCSPLOWO2_12_FULL_63_13]